MKQWLTRVLLVSIGVAAIPAAAHAQWWAQHPAYVHAMSNLRTAAWLIEHHDPQDPGQNADESGAIQEIRTAYEELKQAAAWDGKNANEQPPPGMAFGDHSGRLHRAYELLSEAHAQLNGEEDNPAVLDLRRRANVHVDNALRMTKAALQDWSF
jgi:hypothetical protein